MSLTSPDEEEPRRREDGPVQRPERGAGHEDGHQEREPAQHLVAEGDGYRVGRQDVLPAEHHEVGDVGDHVRDRYQGH